MAGRGSNARWEFRESLAPSFLNCIVQASKHRVTGELALYKTIPIQGLLASLGLSATDHSVMPSRASEVVILTGFCCFSSVNMVRWGLERY